MMTAFLLMSLGSIIPLKKAFIMQFGMFRAYVNYAFDKFGNPYEYNMVLKALIFEKQYVYESIAIWKHAEN